MSNDLAREALQALLDDRRVALGSSHRKRIAAALLSLNGEAWPVGCHDPASCSRHNECMYVGCRHAGTNAMTSTTSGSAAK